MNKHNYKTKQIKNKNKIKMSINISRLPNFLQQQEINESKYHELQEQMVLKQVH